MHSYVDNELLNQRISFEEVTIIVLDECREGGLKLSDFVIQNLVIHIALAIRRITEGFKISKLEEEELKLCELPERQIADNILKRVSVSTGIDFPVEEVDYITLHLISKVMEMRAMFPKACKSGCVKSSLTVLKKSIQKSKTIFS